LDEKNVSIGSCKAELDNLFSERGEFGSPFVGLETEYLQKKYFKTHFDLIVSYPIIIVQTIESHVYRSLLAYILGNAEFGREEEPSEDV